MLVLLPEFKQLLFILKKHDVSFMLIGGYAVIYYGYERTTNDLDVWLQPDNSNRDKLIAALIDFGIREDSLQKISALDFKEPQMFFFGEKPRRIDFLTKISQVSYEEAAKQVNYLTMSEGKIPVIHYDHLILSKITNERPGDKADVEELQRIHKYKTSDSFFSKLKNIIRKK